MLKKIDEVTPFHSIISSVKLGRFDYPSTVIAIERELYELFAAPYVGNRTVVGALQTSGCVQMLWGERRGVGDYRRGSEPTDGARNAKEQAVRP